MSRKLRTVVIAPAYNEEAKIGRVVSKMPWDAVEAVWVVDDGSTDQTAAVARAAGARVLTLPRVSGVGAALRAGLEQARREGFAVAVILAGNDKDDPAQIPRLLRPIREQDYDFVMGSRFLPGGAYGGDMPRYRRWATRLHPWLIGKRLGRRITESTNGFRAFKLSLLDDPRINLHQRWLDGYALEVYLLWQVLRWGYRYMEVPCAKIYPPRRVGYTKMRPLVDWWDMLRPIGLLSLGVRR